MAFKDRETARAYFRRRYAANREKIRASNAARMKLWRLRHPEEAKEQKRKWGAKNRDRVNAYAKKRRVDHHDRIRQTGWEVAIRERYGLTPETYASILEAQGNACAICRSVSPKTKKNRFFVDHCHVTGKTRGLLCHKCNMGLGNFEDNPRFLLDAISYLAKQDLKEVG